MTRTKRGRPPKEDSKIYQYRVRLSFEELDMLEELCCRTGKTKAEILRNGILIQRGANET